MVFLAKLKHAEDFFFNETYFKYCEVEAIEKGSLKRSSKVLPLVVEWAFQLFQEQII